MHKPVDVIVAIKSPNKPIEFFEFDTKSDDPESALKDYIEDHKTRLTKAGELDSQIAVYEINDYTTLTTKWI